MSGREIRLDRGPAKQTHAASRIGRLALLPIVVGLLTAASFLVLIYQENRSVQYRIEATEVWSAHQLKIVQSQIEEDPNLKAQYSEEQEVLRRRAQDLRNESSDARHVVMISAYATLLLLLGAATSILALVANRNHGQKDAQAVQPTVQPIAQEALRQNS
jgi:hypothetical protein